MSNFVFDVRFFISWEQFDFDVSNFVFDESNSNLLWAICDLIWAICIHVSNLYFMWQLWATVLEYSSSISFLVERRSSLTSISEISFHGIKKCWKCYIIIIYATKCEKFPNENGEVKSKYIYESDVGIDYLRWFHAKLNRAHGEVARMQIDCRCQKVRQFSSFFPAFVVSKLSCNLSARA